MGEQTERGNVLNERIKTLSTRYGVWTIEAKHTRPGGDLDVILGFRVYGKSRTRLFGFRRDEGAWTQLAGSWAMLPTAVREAARTTRTQVFAASHVTPLLDLAADLGDFPPPREDA